jgi:hypothetical protein
MHDYIRSLPRRTIVIVFGILYVIPLLMVTFPPFYLFASGRGTLVLGMPLTIWYWLFDYILLLLGLWGLYVVEDIRGELEESVTSSSTTEMGA